MLVTGAFFSPNARAQVANDNIENRRVLKLNETSLSVLVTEAVSGRILLNKQLVNQPNESKMGWVATSQWQAAGIRKVAVEIVCHPLRGRFSTDRLLFDVPPPAVVP